MSEDLIFISYSRADGEFALDLAQKLRQSGANIWLDQLDIKPSMHWDNTIEEALASCSTMLILLSETSVQSENVKDEYSYAIEQGKQVFPLLLEPCEIPFRLKRLQYTDFSTDPGQGFQALMKSLQMDQAKSAISLKAPIKKPMTANQKAIKKAEKKGKMAYALLGVFVVAAVLTGVFWNQLFPDTSPGRLTVTVTPYGEIESDYFPDQGTVVIAAAGQQQEAQINLDGTAEFKEIPAAWFNDNTTVRFDFKDANNEPYHTIYKDSVFTLQRDGSINLPIRLMGLDIIKGVVRDFGNGDPLSDVLVSVNGVEVKTNQSGSFSIELEASQQKKFQTIRAFKEGYQLYEIQNVPIQTDQEIPILMKIKDL